ncbi:Diphthamide biosynthesis protein 1 [Yarrowia lipolytica]|jgi:2-(3-amino-3-carboxypropyl)histidine synthase|uniref:2-(3-amino-3-carboxypropyl)histidine synthase subunit 1 n=2 Tax=Yarrowia lipolytica TaxID=4952 RepID=DPH1_YARLI|nr:YALI0F22055p [Yarrowia lipolytica CLIB122]Q6C0S8.1 RecName: Full=2-(3-amino-3-carboxypropyl)histidine synthase subunit 1; AltName: Full=Diphthamide biosynthesis protein 1; AltName: Full=Diphtheria toxin resistance protein 1; AltName: Full=S-adenosyl-L-methionine:L-histidine 3-amino-3-carboxypropyltransferase 1 [Yarrowia lipolytica CLIB122]AOW07548.1 hypothetical protein YALI1_F29192g [Yarrowia lipolytica]KAB8281298.1 Diphthamide biosynthesis protein 1 [Yarrowia lipolytica]KAE8170600.1 Diphth|eukprot:XP_505734.1 YALI0F22055p [Yarrowia lipolytica CLIB122]
MSCSASGECKSTTATPVAPCDPDTCKKSTSTQPRKRFVGRANGSGPSASTSLVKNTTRRPRIINQIPDEILNDEELNEVIATTLPKNYNFEIHKSIWHIRKNNCKKIALQMPEGLLIYACIISDIIEQFCGPDISTVVMGDVTYGACCVDDFSAIALGCDFLIHYAHSCLVPIDSIKIKVLYVFVTIEIDTDHVVKSFKKNFETGTRMAMVGTIQFNPTIHTLKDRLLNEAGIVCTAPQIMPLSKGEVLGCTSANMSTEDYDMIMYIGDGRFHLESAMIHNPDIPAYRYDPYSRKLTREYFDQVEMVSVRKRAIQTAKNAKTIGLILGTLGRQGNTATLDMLQEKLNSKGYETHIVLLSEIFPAKLALFDGVDAWVQVACPRLSIDWGYAFPKPLLTPYEAMVMMDEDTLEGNDYPMDYYGKEGYGRGKQPRAKKEIAI